MRNTKTPLYQRPILYLLLVLISVIPLKSASFALSAAPGQSIALLAQKDKGPGGAQASPPVVSPQSDKLSNDAYAQSFKVLFTLFVLATLLESGLSVIFNWRPFIIEFDSRGIKTVISVIVSYVFVTVFHFDIVTRLVNIYSGSTSENYFPGSMLTALILSGGSSGVNNILVALGFRSVKTRIQAGMQPAPTEAWIAVNLTRTNAVGSVLVLIGPSDSVPLPVAGTIIGDKHPPQWIRFFVKDSCRFPTSGGFALKPDATAYKIKLEGRDVAGSAIYSTEWGPHPLLPGALVNVTLEI